MGKKKKIKVSAKSVPAGAAKSKKKKTFGKEYWYYLLPVLALTAICFSPMLKNGFTNWDDEQYVLQNALLKGPDWVGIFTQPVVSNYHPLTIISLAINYSISGLEASSYLYFNFFLHLVNTILVFNFILKISRGSLLAALVTSALFGIHPMHVESVAWISERKDVLYTMFFLLSLIQYWGFLESQKNKNLVYCFLFFLLSLLSKPAAIILPLVLLLLDYWHGRKINGKAVIEKIPFFLASGLFAILTLLFQSKSAIASLDYYPVWTRFFFASYVIMIYAVRFFLPYPLSAFHPYPPPGDLGLPVLLSPIFLIAIIGVVWYFRKNKLVVFSSLFFLVNLALVLQIISIGNTLVAERYTYVPYIGLAFLAGMLIDKSLSFNYKKTVLGLVAVISLVFGFMTFNRTGVWNNSEKLWTNVISHYPNAPVPRTNRANYLMRQSDLPENAGRKAEMLQQALDDCNISLAYKPDHAKGYENRQNIYVRQNKDTLAMKDADTLIRLEPDNYYGYYIKGFIYNKWGSPDSALKYFNSSLDLNANLDYALNHRGTLLFNYFKQYDKAIEDFSKAISLNPSGSYYLNRSKCYYRLGEVGKAKEDARVSLQKGQTIDAAYRQLLNL